MITKGEAIYLTVSIFFGGLGLYAIYLLKECRDVIKDVKKRLYKENE